MELVLIIFVFIFVIGPLVSAYSKRMSQQLPAGDDQTRAQLAQLRDEVDRLSAEVEKLSDEQSFLLRLLSPADQEAAARARLAPAAPTVYDANHHPEPGEA